MNRLQPPPSHLVARVLLLGLAFSLLLLWTGGAGSWSNTFSMISASLPLPPESGETLHLLLPRSLRTLVLVLLALFMGLSFALAAALLISHLGGRAMRLAAWLGRAMAGVPPMGWAMGALLLILRDWHLPVETLFPHQTPEVLDTWNLRIARKLWTWLAPGLVLALPLFGSAFFSLCYRLSALLTSHGGETLRARGLRRSWIVHRHFAPLLGVHMARMARPAVAVLLCFAIPVEEVFGFDGWGRFLATRLYSSAPHTLELAAAMWSGAWMLAVLLIMAGLTDRRSLPLSLEEINDQGQRQSAVSAVLGGVLLIALIVPFASGMPGTPWEELMRSHALWFSELLRALGAALGALLLVVLGVPLLMPSLRFAWLAGGGFLASLSLAPLFLMLLLWEQVHARSTLAVLVALAAPGLAALRAFFLSDTWGGIRDSARAVGETTWGICQRHLLRIAVPSLLNWTLRTAGTALILYSVLDFYDESRQGLPSSSWGAMMRASHDDLLEHPVLALGPALWIALWNLSFRLLSRAFKTQSPQNRPSTFAP